MQSVDNPGTSCSDAQSSFNVSVVKDWNEAFSIVKSYELSSGTKYVCCKQDKRSEHIDHTVPSFYENKKVQYESTIESGHTGTQKTCFDGAPHVYVGRTVLHCHRGKLLYKITKGVEFSEEHSDHDFKKTRKRLQTTKKIDCPSKVVMLEVLSFPEFSIPRSTKNLRDTASKRLRQELLTSPDKLQSERQIYVCIPAANNHIGHPVGKDGVQHLPIDKDLGNVIKTKVQSGIMSLGEMRRSINDYIINSKFKNEKDSALLDTQDRRFFPTDTDILNHMHKAILQLRRASCDQENLSHLVEDWKKENPDNKIFYRLHGEVGECDAVIQENVGEDEERTWFEDPTPQKIVFVYQSAFQKQLLQVDSDVVGKFRLTSNEPESSNQELQHASPDVPMMDISPPHIPVEENPDPDNVEVIIFIDDDDDVEVSVTNTENRSAEDICENCDVNLSNLSTNSLAIKCREDLKTLIDATYRVTDPHAFHVVIEGLKPLIHYLNFVAPNENGLPVNPTKQVVEQNVKTSTKPPGVKTLPLPKRHKKNPHGQKATEMCKHYVSVPVQVTEEKI